KPVLCIDWCHNGRECLGLVNKQGPLWLWHIEDSKHLSLVKETQNFSSAITLFRWHHQRHNQIAFGHEDGSVSILEIDFKKLPGSKAAKHLFRPEAVSESVEDTDPVVALEWDPLSTDYLLVCNHRAGVRLLDVPTQTTIMDFQLPSAASRVQTMSWVKNAPGMFLTGDYKGGILRVWSVSNSTPIENIKIKGTGFHRLEVIHPPANSNSSNNNSNSHSSSQGSLDDKDNHHVSSTSEARSPAMTTLSHFTLPHSHVVCAFNDGGIGLYDLGRKKWVFLRDQGHIETIFDCKFKPDNPDLLATASFDGSIKVWDITSMTCLLSSPGNEGIIYQISWAPSDLDCIVASTARTGVFVWDTTKGKVITRLNNHVAKTSVFSVSWNQADSRRIMTCGMDSYCVIQQVDGTVLQKYKHPAAVYGGDWSPFNKDMLATACEDKCVRVFYMASHSDQPIKVFSGHSAKVFRVRWNPLKEGVLASGSDDGTIRVWDYTRDQCTCTLQGHTAPVRGLTWNSEVASLLVSGSWDSSIRVWDTRDGACLYSLLDHGADVYGLTSHPARPFLLVSSSRDSTVRLWSTTSLVQPVELAMLADRPWTEAKVSGEPSNSSTTSLSLVGKVSVQLQSTHSLKGARSPKTIEAFSRFFSHPCGTNNLWDLVGAVGGSDTMMLSPAYPHGIVHRKHITQFKGSEAQQQEMIKMSKFGAGIGAPGKEERLMGAAATHIRLGNVQRYCELMVEVGKWERALAVAPAVSMKYWQQLNQRYSTALLREDSDDAVPFCVAAGDVPGLASFFTARGQLNDAVLVTQAACEGSISAPKVKGDSKERRHQRNNSSGAVFDSLAVEAMETLADFHFRNGSPTLAACCHLAVDDQKKAMSKLIRGHELELALSVGRVLGGATEETDVVLELLSRRCETLGKWDLGLDLLRLQRSPALTQALLCARCSSSMAEIDALLHKAGLPSMSSCEEKAKSLEASGCDVFDCVKLYLLSPVPERGLQLGLRALRGKLQSPNYTADDVVPMLRLLGCIKTEKLQHSKQTESMHELLALSAYFGGLVAIKRKYFPVVLPLFEHARSVISRNSLQLAISDKQIEADARIFFAMLENRLTEDLRPQYQALLTRCGSDTEWVVEAGEDCVASSHLPSHSDVHTSYLSNQRIKGQPYFLEDGRSCVSLNEALMWAKVNPFSPLASGVRINPF
ncbi:WD repeat-containing protein 17, partial [Aplysia californica]|uniref:WD repeat-containing protein 17 n=1 Tax=Aplysia californica TaxID=6500 RepID=A0ABM1AE62_APLCA